MEPLAAFSNNMTEQQAVAFDDYIDWSKVDLLDACLDPSLVGMGPDSSGPLGACRSASHTSDPVGPGVVFQDDFFQRGMGGFSGLENDHHPYGTREDVTENPDPASPSSNPSQMIAQSGQLESLTCSGCGARFEDSWSAKTHKFETTAGRCSQVHTCVTCNASFLDSWKLKFHGDSSGHPIFACNHNGCNQVFVSREEKWVHQQVPHTAGHSRLEPASPYQCVECKQSLSTKADLLRHGKALQHRPYGCECGIFFSRLDVLNRHLKSFGTDIPRYPCKYCRRHRGENGFRRLDHYKQHVRNYHHHDVEDQVSASAQNPAGRSKKQYVFPVCTHPDCPKFRGPEFQQLSLSAKEADKPFQTQSEYTKHMRDEHNECLYPCDVVGCERIGRKGYFREKDMIKHRREQHPDAAPYQSVKRETRHRCTEPGCGAILDLSSLYWHYEYHEYERKQLRYVLPTLIASDKIQCALAGEPTSNI